MEYVYNEQTGEYDTVEKTATILKFDVLTDIFVEIIPTLELFNFTSPETPSTEKFKEALEDFDFLSFFGGGKRKKRDVKTSSSTSADEKKPAIDFEGEELLQESAAENEGSGELIRTPRQTSEGSGDESTTLDPLMEAQGFYATLYGDIDRFVTTLARVFRNTTNTRWKRSHEGADSCSFLYALPRFLVYMTLCGYLPTFY